MYDDDGARVARAVAARLPSGAVVKVETSDAGSAGFGDGMSSVGLKSGLHLDGTPELGKALDSVGEIAGLVCQQVEKVAPSKATVQLKLGFTVEAGKLTALWVGGKGDAALTVTMEWSGGSSAPDLGDGSTGTAGNG